MPTNQPSRIPFTLAHTGLKLCEATCDIRDYEMAKADHKRRYEAGCLLEPEERDREYAAFQRNRMKDNDERFAVKCAQRCFKT